MLISKTRGQSSAACAWTLKRTESPACPRATTMIGSRRWGASSAPVGWMNIYWAFAEGFIKETAATLTEAEVNTLGISCFALACELATRFLDDYILGDKYFKINYPEHNLVRTRCQIALAKDMRKKMDAMNAIARDCWMRYR